MSGRTVLYLAAPIVLLGLWTAAFALWGDNGSRRTGPRVEMGVPTVVEETVKPPAAALDPAMQELLKPLEESRQEWMNAMAVEREAMISHAFGLLDELEKELDEQP